MIRAGGFPLRPLFFLFFQYLKSHALPCQCAVTCSRTCHGVMPAAVSVV